MGNTCPTTAKSQPVSASVNPVTPQRRRAATVTSSPTAQPAAGIGRIPILDVCPTVSHGRWAAKAVVGEMVPIEATVFREGHDAVGATAVLLSPRGKRHTARMVDIAPGLDRFQGFLAPPNPDGGKSKSKHGQTPMAPGNTTPASKSLPESTRNSCAQKVSCYSNAQHVNAASHPKTKLRCAPLSRPFATQHCHHKPALRQQLPHRSPRSCGTGHLFATLSHRHRHTR